MPKKLFCFVQTFMLSAVFFLSFFLSACGQKGALFLPSTDKKSPPIAEKNVKNVKNAKVDDDKTTTVPASAD